MVPDFDKRFFVDVFLKEVKEKVQKKHGGHAIVNFSARLRVLCIKCHVINGCKTAITNN
jgi:hypothetical protein